VIFLKSSFRAVTSLLHQKSADLFFSTGFALRLRGAVSAACSGIESAGTVSKSVLAVFWLLLNAQSLGKAARPFGGAHPDHADSQKKTEEGASLTL